MIVQTVDLDNPNGKESIKDYLPFVISIFLIFLIVSSGGYIIYYQIVNQIHSCTSNPLIYASNKFLEEYGSPLKGSGTFRDADGELFRLEFNETNVLVYDANLPINGLRRNTIYINLTELNNLVPNSS